MFTTCTSCGTKSDASKDNFKLLIGALSVIVFMLALAVMFASSAIIGFMMMIPSIWFAVLASSKKLPKCKVCGGFSIPYVPRDKWPTQL